MARPAVFLDRDGTINHEVFYLSNMGDLKLLPGTVEGLRLLRDAGYLLILVTNQSGVARGYFSERRVKRINGRLRRMLKKAGIHLAGIFYCPFHPGARLRRYRKQSSCRKPEAGMLFQAAEIYAIDLAASWMIGDKPADVAAGRAAGCRTILVQTGYGSGEQNTEAEMTAANLGEAARYIIDIIDRDA